jgi:hypothetical protein
MDGEPAARDRFLGVGTSWNRVPGGQAVGRLVERALAEFKIDDPAASVPRLLELRSELSRLPASPIVDYKRKQLDWLLQACLGLTVETTVVQAEVLPGEKVMLNHSAVVRSSVPVRWRGVRSGGAANTGMNEIALRQNSPAVRQETQAISGNATVSQPYWLAEPALTGTFRVTDPKLIGRPENPPVLPIEQIFEVGGQELVIQGEPWEVVGKDARQTTPRRLTIVSPVALSFDYEVARFQPGTSRPVRVHIAATRGAVAGELRLQAPAGWNVTPESRRFQIGTAAEKAEALFTVTPPAQVSTAVMTARAEVGSATFNSQRIEIHYDHIPPLLLQPAARLKAIAMDMQVRAKRVGYIAGAGDSIAECLGEMGLSVTVLSAADLVEEKLRGLDAVVIGVRALNVRNDLAAGMPALLAFVQSGGNLIVQYNRPGVAAETYFPYPLRISSDRVVDEQSPVKFLAPTHPALNVPNRISLADFDGWVQERGLYFANQWDERYVPLLEFNDPGERPLTSGILVAPHGRGHLVYTSLAWFRQLPAGVPGAYRLFANLVSLGKP